MKKSKLTKKALLSSILVILMSITMLIGTTFAWFTDTASTSVNKIQAGNLDVSLEMKNPDYDSSNNESKEWIDAEGKTLDFKKADNTTTILWEPGCTYELPELRISNNGNLALKYMISITGIQGDAKLNDAIEWTITIGGNTYNISEEQHLDAKVGDQIDSDILTIKGHMKEDAGNEYRGLSIDDIAITVYATQDTVEYDSKDNQYDANASFDGYVNVTKTVSTDSETIIQDKETNPTIVAKVPQGSTTASELALIKEVTETPSNIEISTTESAISFDVKIIDTQTQEVVSATGDTFFTIDLEIGVVELISFYHNNVALTKVTKLANLNSAGQYYYNAKTGVVTYTTQSFSPFTAKIKYSGGNGLAASPYLINDAAQLGSTSSDKTSYKKGTYFNLTNNIVLTSNEKTFAYNDNDGNPQYYLVYNNGLGRTYNLGDYVITTESGLEADFGLLVSGGSTGPTTTINANEKGGIDTTSANAYCVNVKGSKSNTKLTINGGTYKGAVSCIQVDIGTCTINGGFFEATTPGATTRIDGAKYTLNCFDDNYIAGTAKIVVQGGTFVNYDPSKSASEKGDVRNFVASGYKVVSKEQANGDIWYTVVEDVKE